MRPTGLSTGNSGPRGRTPPSRTRQAARPAGVYVLIGLLLLLSVSALFGGGALILDPSGSSLEIPVALLDGSPFRDYLLPGVVLFGLLGVLPLAVVLALWRKPRWGWVKRFSVHAAWLAAVGVGVALIVWILLQMTILLFFLQPILLVVGVAIIGVSMLPTVRRHYR